MHEKRPRTARPVTPNKGLEMSFRRQLLDMVAEMQRSVLWWVGATYKARLPEIVQDAALPNWKRALLYAMDASPSRDLERELKKIMRRWQGNFSKMALQLAQKNVRNSNTSAVSAMQAALKDAGFTVKMRNTRAVNDVLQSLIIDQTKIITSIPEKYMGEVQALIMRSVREGRDMGFLTTQLEARYDITRKRAITISRDQTNKATESISRVRNKALGITHGVWMHLSGSKKPRHSHIEANGKVFDLSIGLMVDGETIFPGEMVNCHCTYRPVLPTFPGEETQA